MPIVKPLPITPTKPTAAAGRSSIAASGSFAASAEGIGAFSGPWLIEEQKLDITYWRVPAGSPTNFSTTLSSITHTYGINQTRLAWTCYGSYKRYKSYDHYATSGWSQSQLFEILAVSADAEGNTYGDIDASTLGPMGSVITTRPHYVRRDWNDAVDTEVDEATYGANFTWGASGYDGTMQTGAGYEQTIMYGKTDEFAVHWAWAGYPYNLNPNTKHIVNQPWTANYDLPGTYSTDQESGHFLTNFIDGVGDSLTSPTTWSGAYTIPPTVSDSGTYYLANAKVPSYNSLRHDWS